MPPPEPTAFPPQRVSVTSALSKSCRRYAHCTLRSPWSTTRQARSAPSPHSRLGSLPTNHSRDSCNDCSPRESSQRTAYQGHEWIAGRHGVGAAWRAGSWRGPKHWFAEGGRTSNAPQGTRATSGGSQAAHPRISEKIDTYPRRESSTCQQLRQRRGPLRQPAASPSLPRRLGPRCPLPASTSVPEPHLALGACLVSKGSTSTERQSSPMEIFTWGDAPCALSSKSVSPELLDPLPA